MNETALEIPDTTLLPEIVAPLPQILNSDATRSRRLGLKPIRALNTLKQSMITRALRTLILSQSFSSTINT